MNSTIEQFKNTLIFQFYQNSLLKLIRSIKQTIIIRFTESLAKKIPHLMTQIVNSRMLTSASDEASNIDNVLTRIQDKLQTIIMKTGSANLQTKSLSQMFTTDQRLNPLHQSTESTTKAKEKCIRILHQVEILETYFMDKSNYPLLTDSKINDMAVKRSFESTSSKKCIQSYIQNSFAIKDHRKDDALKQIMLTLCNQSQLELKSRIFLKGQIQEHFSRAQFQDHISVQESKNSTQMYIENFITQIGELRSKIQILEDQKINLMKQKKQIEQKLIDLTFHDKFQNPQLAYDKKQCTFSKNANSKDYELSSKLQQENKYMGFKVRKMEEIVMRKQNMITQMNEQFVEQIKKYNKVFERLSTENETLKRYIDQDLECLIEDLEAEIYELRAREQHRNYESQQYNRRYPEMIPSQANHYRGRLKYDSYATRVPSQEYMGSNIFSRCSIQDYLPENRGRSSYMRQDGRSKSKHQRKSMESRSRSIKSNRNNVLKTLNSKRYTGIRYDGRSVSRKQRD